METDESELMLIVYEGIDGSGKSTQHRNTEAWLKDKGIKVQALREPTDGPYGAKLRRSALEGRLSPEAELDLFIEDRRWNLKEHIQPALSEGFIVLLDRYYYSTIAYQSARGVDANMIKQRNEQFAPRPDLVLLYDLEPKIAVERIKDSRGETPNLFEKVEYLQSVRDNFLKIIDPVITRIDASKPADEVWTITRRIVSRLLQLEDPY